MDALAQIITWMKKRSSTSAQLAKQAEAELAALRERAEKAEAERDFYRRQFPTAAKNWQKATQAGDA